MHISSMNEIIYDYYASRIQFGYYVSGDTLPSYSYICKQFQVSTLTVRAAFHRLRQEGFIKTTERKRATVIYRPDEQVEHQYLHSFFARKEGMDDICRTAGFVFGPIAYSYFQQQNDVSLNRIRSQLKKENGHPAKQITLFYSEAMQPLNNSLALNLYWEVVRYLRTPYLKQAVNFDTKNPQAAEHINRMLSLVEAGSPEKATQEMLSFNENVIQSFFNHLPVTPDDGSQTKQIPFKWQIYREHPQLCYTLAAEIIYRIDSGIYSQGETLSSCQSLAEEYGVSLITMRRTLQLLGELHVTKTYNGIGTKIVIDKETGIPNFSHLQIQKSLIMFLQALQIGTLTCKNVATHTLSSLDDAGFQVLDRNIQQNIQEQKAFLLGETCLLFIGDNSPSAFIKEVYRQLYLLLLWGHCLHLFFQKSEGTYSYSSYAIRIRDALHLHDIQNFANLLFELLTVTTKAEKNIMLDLGFSKDKLI